MAFNWSKLIEEHGGNKVAIKALQIVVAAIQKDVSSLRESRAYIRGGWAVICIVAAVAGAIGALISRAIWH